MTQSTSNKIPRNQEAKAPDKNKTQAPTLGTLLATALGIAYGAWAVIVWGSGFSEEHLPSSPQTKAQSCQVEWGNKAPCRRWRQNRALAQVLRQEPQGNSQSPKSRATNPNRNTHNQH